MSFYLYFDYHRKVSVGEKLIRNFLKSNNFTLLNASDRVKGGPFTRYNPSAPYDSDQKSCIDLIIVSNELVKYVDVVTIDSDLNFTPGRPVGKGKSVFTDHYAILISLKNLPLSDIVVPEKKMRDEMKDGEMYRL